MNNNKQITDDIEFRLFDLIQTNRESIDLSLKKKLSDEHKRLVGENPDITREEIIKGLSDSVRNELELINNERITNTLTHHIPRISFWISLWGIITILMFLLIIVMFVNNIR